MALKGDLASVDLAQVFQMLVLNQKTGILSIFSHTAWRALYFDSRGVTLHFNPYTFPDKVLEHLVRTGRVAEDLVPKAKDYAYTHECPFPMALEKVGGLSQAEYLQVFSQKMEEEIYDLFFWKEARFEFFEGATELPGKEGVIDESFFFNPDSLIMEAARRMDEWSVIQTRISGEDEILTPAVDLSQVNLMDLDDMTLSVFDLVDGKRTVKRIVEITGFSPFHVFKTLATLIDQGLVQILGPEAMVENANECIAEGRVQDGINLLERAASMGVGGPEIHLSTAQAYESIQELERASAHYKFYAEDMIALGKQGEALKTLKKLVALIPTDLEAREKLVFLSLSSGEEGKKLDLDPIAEGRTLIEIYVEMEEFERARSVVENLLEVSPGDLELIKALVTIHSKAGDTRRVLELYEVLAEELIRRKDLMGAIKYLQKILLIDKDRKDVSERVRQLYQQEERARSRKRGITALIAVVLLLGALGALYTWYEMNARAAYADIDPAPYLERKDFAGAAGLYENFLNKYPLSLMRSTVKQDLENIHEKEEAWKRQEAARKAAREAALARKRAAYKKLFKRYEELGRDKRDLVGALAALEESARLVKEAGQPEDFAWAESVGLNSGLRDLRAYLKGAEEAKKKMDAFLRKGEYHLAWLQGRAILEKYSFSPLAQSLEIPVRILSRPSGAGVWAGGKPLKDSDGRPLRTPCTLAIPARNKVTVELRKKGFRPLKKTIDPAMGSPLKFSLALEPEREISLSSPPALATTGEGGFLVAGLAGGRLAGLDRSGRQAWVLELPGLSEVTGGPSVRGGKVYFATSGKMARCVDLAAGKDLWRTPLDGVVKVPPLVTQEGVIMATTGGRVYLLGLEKGKPRWSVSAGGGVRAQPVLYGSRVLVPLDTGVVVALDLASGARREVYVAGGSIRSRPLAQGDYLLVAAMDGKVHCFRVDGGEKVWVFDQRVSLRKSTLMAEGGNTVVVGREDGLLFRLNIVTGEVIQEFDLKKRISAGPVLSGGRLYVCTAEKKRRDSLLCLDPDTLVPLWEYPFPGRVVPPLEVDSGKMLVTCMNRKVYVFP